MHKEKRKNKGAGSITSIQTPQQTKEAKIGNRFCTTTVVAAGGGEGGRVSVYTYTTAFPLDKTILHLLILFPIHVQLVGRIQIAGVKE